MENGYFGIDELSMPLVIPEIGINHNGSLKIAFQMVDAAQRAGAKLIKHQTHIIHDEMSGIGKLVAPGNSDKSIFQIMNVPYALLHTTILYPTPVQLVRLGALQEMMQRY